MNCSTASNLLKGVGQEQSDKKIGWIPKKNIQDMIVHTENIILTRFTAYHYFKKASENTFKSFQARNESTHTPNHTITRHHQFAECKQCYPRQETGAVVSSSSVKIL